MGLQGYLGGMAYVIRALIVNALALDALSSLGHDIPVTDLGQGLSLVPVTKSRLKEFGSKERIFAVGEDGEFDDYTIGIAKTLGRISRQGAAAFIGPEFHGGSGTQLGRRPLRTPLSAPAIHWYGCHESIASSNGRCQDPAGRRVRHA